MKNTKGDNEEIKEEQKPGLSPELVQRGNFMVKAEKRETRKSSRINEKKVDEDGNEIIEEQKVKIIKKKDPELK